MAHGVWPGALLQAPRLLTVGFPFFRAFMRVGYEESRDLTFIPTYFPIIVPRFFIYIICTAVGPVGGWRRIGRSALSGLPM